jgi:hypothetical protein
LAAAASLCARLLELADAALDPFQMALEGLGLVFEERQLVLSSGLT